MKLALALLLAAVAAIALAIAAAWAFGAGKPAEDGFLRGHVSIGPLCPVERNPPDPACRPTLQTYLAHPLSVYPSGTSGKIAEFHGDGNGNYSIALPPGTYDVKSSGSISNFFRTVTIEAGKTATLDVDIDTGMR